MQMRTHTCGQVDTGSLGEEVELVGWVNRRRDHGGVIFVDLRDRDGLVQVVKITPPWSRRRLTHPTSSISRSSSAWSTCPQVCVRIGIVIKSVVVKSPLW